MGIVLEFFPHAVVELSREIQHHPLLTATLAPGMTLEEKLGHVAAYCNVAIDDYLLEDDLDILVKLLLQRLQSKNTLIVN